MSSDDVLLRREPMYFGEASSACFGWYHYAIAAPARDCVAVLCSAMGPEYTRSHRSMRHLADRLAAHGVPALRFDYHGVGDSPGTDLDAERWSSWLASVRAAIRSARELSGRERVCLIGVRLGATLAASVAAEDPVELLVLWSPCARGRSYVRELQAMSLTAEHGTPQAPAAMESGGWRIAAETLASLRAFDLSHASIRAQRVLLLGRDDLAPDTSLYEHLSGAGVPTDHLTVAGYAGMMAEHQFTVVPQAALDSIVGWAEAHSAPWQAESRVAAARRARISLSPGIEEQLCRFGAEERLFGVLTRASGSTHHSVVVLLNAGSVHHVGPHGLYVMLSRELAAAGFSCFRFDLEGIGDSVGPSAHRENHPYQENALADARAALEYLKDQFGYTRFILMGICSGAHTAFHAGLELEHLVIPELVLINPLTFRWEEGMSLETSVLARNALHYTKAARDPRRWLKLLSGRVNFRNLVRASFGYAASLAKSYYDAMREPLRAGAAPLTRDLTRLFRLGRRVTLVLAEGEPGHALLMNGARRAATQGLRAGKIRLYKIAGTDHTFSRSSARGELIARLRSLARQAEAAFASKIEAEPPAQIARMLAGEKCEQTVRGPGMRRPRTHAGAVERSELKLRR